MPRSNPLSTLEPEARAGWVVALANQALWLAWIVLTELWGFLPMNIALTALYARNYWKWQT
jgi:hypothetical protein